MGTEVDLRRFGFGFVAADGFGGGLDLLLVGVTAPGDAAYGEDPLAPAAARVAPAEVLSVAGCLE